MAHTGRPEENDEEPLYAMAEIMDKNPEMNITHVIRIVMESMSSFHSEEAVIKRLRRKFNLHREFLLSRIRSRKERPVVYIPTTFSVLQSISASMDLSRFAGVADAVSSMDMSAAVRAADMVSRIDMSGVARAAEMASRIDMSGVVRAAEMAARMDMSGVARAADMAARMDMSGVVRAIDRINSLNFQFR